MKDYRKLNLFITIILICCFCIESITAATLPSVNAVGGFIEKRTGTCDICGFTYTFYR